MNNSTYVGVVDLGFAIKEICFAESKLQEVSNLSKFVSQENCVRVLKWFDPINLFETLGN